MRQLLEPPLLGSTAEQRAALIHGPARLGAEALDLEPPVDRPPPEPSAALHGSPDAVASGVSAHGLATGSLVAHDDTTISTLRESVALLARSPARLEHAYSIVELGAAPASCQPPR